jgi:hypothetical protein
VKSARDRLLDAHEPFLEASLGRGRLLLLSEKRIEWVVPGARVATELSKLKGVRLAKRPPFEALMFALAFGGAAALVPWLWLRIAFAALAVLALAACALQRRFDIVFEREDGRAALLLGIARPNASTSRRIESIWQTIAEELKRLGVPVALAVMVLFASACGYRFAAGAPLPEGTREVYAPVFKNNTAEPGLEAVFTESLRQQLIRAGVAGDDHSAARIEGEVQGVGASPTIVAPSANKLASYRISASAHLKLVKEGRVLVDTVVGGSEDYLPGADVLATESNRQAALRRLADAMMRDGLTRLSTVW